MVLLVLVLLVSASFLRVSRWIARVHSYAYIIIKLYLFIIFYVYVYAYMYDLHICAAVREIKHACLMRVLVLD